MNHSTLNMIPNDVRTSLLLVAHSTFEQHQLTLIDNHKWLHNFITTIQSTNGGGGGQNQKYHNNNNRPVIAELMKTPARKRATHLNILTDSTAGVGLLFPAATVAPSTSTSALNSTTPRSPAKILDKENQQRPINPRLLSPVARTVASSTSRSNSPKSIRSHSIKSASSATASSLVETAGKGGDMEEIISQPLTSTSSQGVAKSPLNDDARVMEEVLAEMSVEDVSVELGGEPEESQAISLSEVAIQAELSMIGEEEEEEQVDETEAEVMIEDGQGSTISDDLVERHLILSPSLRVVDSTLSQSALPVTDIHGTISSSKTAEHDDEEDVPLNDDPSHARSLASQDQNTNNRTPGNNSISSSLSRMGAYSASATTGLGIHAFSSPPPHLPHSTSIFSLATQTLPPTSHRLPTSSLTASTFRPSVGGGGKLNFVGLPSYKEREQSMGLTLGRASISIDSIPVATMSNKRKSITTLEGEAASKVLRRSDTDSSDMSGASSRVVVAPVGDPTAKDRMGLLKSRLQNLTARSSIHPAAASISAPSTSLVRSASMAFTPTPHVIPTATTLPASPRPNPVSTHPFNSINSTTPRSPPPPSAHVQHFSTLKRQGSVTALVKSFEGNHDDRLPVPPLSPSMKFYASPSTNSLLSPSHPSRPISLSPVLKSPSTLPATKLPVRSPKSPNRGLGNQKDSSLASPLRMVLRSPPRVIASPAVSSRAAQPVVVEAEQSLPSISATLAAGQEKEAPVVAAVPVPDEIVAMSSPLRKILKKHQDLEGDVIDEEEVERELMHQRKEAALPDLPQVDPSLVLDGEEDDDLVVVDESGVASAMESVVVLLNEKEGEMKVPGAFIIGDDEVEDLDTDSRSKLVVSPTESTQSQSQSSSLFGVVSNALVKPFGGKKAKVELKSIASAAAAREKAREDAERKAGAKEDREKRRALALAKKAEEDRKKEEEEEKKLRRERDEMSATSKPIKMIRQKSKLESNDADQSQLQPKKRKLDESKSSSSTNQLPARPEVKKPRDPKDQSAISNTNHPISRPGSSQSNYGPTNGIKPRPTTTSASTFLHKSTTNTTSSATSSMVGVKYMSESVRLMGTTGQPSKVSTLHSSTAATSSSSSATMKAYTNGRVPIASGSGNGMRVVQPAAIAVAVAVVEQEEYVELPDIDSEYSDSGDENHDAKTKALPYWAQSPAIADALERQSRLNPDAIFGNIPALEMDQIFKTKSSRISKRTSSAVWEGTDALTESEKTRYNRQMGYRH